MIASRKKAFYRYIRLLRDIEADLDNLNALRELNLGLVKEILRDEQHIARHKAKVKELKKTLRTERRSKEDAGAIKAKVKRLNGNVERYRDQIYIWKCIGDGIAYAYISSFNIKHAFYDTESTEPKSSAGAIGGKAGLENEIALLLAALGRDVPAVLCDITNVIRYGDVCLLGASDALPIEVKSRQWLNRRGLRQRERLEKLLGFLDNDHAEEFRGAPEVRRASFKLPYKDNLEAFNECIANANRDGWCSVCPERGLIYAALVDGEVKDILAGISSMQLPIFCHLNVDKAEKRWAPYLPFMNSIRDIDRLYDFVIGELSIFVAFDAAHLCEQLVIPSWSVCFIEDEDVALVLSEANGEGRLAISRQMIGRLVFEAMSLNWFTQHERDALQELISEFKTREPVELDESHIRLLTALDKKPKIFVAQ